MKFYKGFCLLSIFCAVNAVPQRNDQLLTNIQNVFGSQNQPITDSRGGFGEIVLPEPEETLNLTPTQSPQVLVNNGQACKCVPYWNCEPDNTPQPATSTTDNRFFGEIDVR